MPRILVLQLKRIGDLILTAPALSALRRAVPQSELVLLAPAGLADLAACMPAVDRVISYRSGRPNLDAWASVVAGPWDICLDFTGTDRSALLSGFSRANRRIGFAKFSAKALRRLAYTEFCQASVRELHTLDFHAALAAQGGGGVLPEPEGFPIMPPATALQSVRSMLSSAGVAGRFAILHPGTAKAEKFWEPERWAEVAAHLARSHGLPVVLTGATGGLEGEHLERMKSALEVPAIDLAGHLSLPELAALISQCALMAGVDSMAMHLASTFQRPQVGLFGPTNPFHWRPRHASAAILIGPDPGPRLEFHPREKPQAMSAISTAAVIGAIDSVLAV